MGTASFIKRYGKMNEEDGFCGKS